MLAYVTIGLNLIAEMLKLLEIKIFLSTKFLDIQINMTTLDSKSKY